MVVVCGRSSGNSGAPGTAPGSAKAPRFSQLPALAAFALGGASTTPPAPAAARDATTRHDRYVTLRGVGVGSGGTGCCNCTPQTGCRTRATTRAALTKRSARTPASACSYGTPARAAHQLGSAAGSAKGAAADAAVAAAAAAAAHPMCRDHGVRCSPGHHACSPALQPRPAATTAAPCTAQQPVPALQARCTRHARPVTAVVGGSTLEGGRGRPPASQGGAPPAARPAWAGMGTRRPAWAALRSLRKPAWAAPPLAPLARAARRRRRRPPRDDCSSSGCAHGARRTSPGLARRLRGRRRGRGSLQQDGRGGAAG